MGKLEAVEQAVEAARAQISLAERMADALGQNVAEVLATITGLG